uniref:Uncharacterized protein n=1 Tax=Salix viminalis TaxID=40686 RepID=A0A6N2MH68_SALVM
MEDRETLKIAKICRCSGFLDDDPTAGTNRRRRAVMTITNHSVGDSKVGRTQWMAKCIIGDREKEAWSEGRKCMILTENERVGMVEWRGPTQHFPRSRGC